MTLDLRDVFAGGGDIEIDTDLPFEDFSVSGVSPVSGLHFCGTVSNRADVVRISGKASFTYSAPCDRCAEPVVREYSYDISHIIVNQLEDEQTADADIVFSENMQLCLDELIRSDIILLLPVKFLCRPDCKGICAGCGKRLNFEECICKKEIDPRLSKLSEFFEV